MNYPFKWKILLSFSPLLTALVWTDKLLFGENVSHRCSDQHSDLFALYRFILSLYFMCSLLFLSAVLWGIFSIQAHYGVCTSREGGQGGAHWFHLRMSYERVWMSGIGLIPINSMLMTGLWTVMTGYYNHITKLGLLQSGPDLMWGWTSIHPHAVYFCLCLCAELWREVPVQIPAAVSYEHSHRTQAVYVPVVWQRLQHETVFRWAHEDTHRWGAQTHSHTYGGWIEIDSILFSFKHNLWLFLL